jgi:hypothetical protein
MSNPAEVQHIVEMLHQVSNRIEDLANGIEQDGEPADADLKREIRQALMSHIETMANEIVFSFVMGKRSTSQSAFEEIDTLARILG